MVVPVFNVAPYLETCVDSIVGQTYRKLEILLVDDGSTDSSGSICDHYARRDGRVTTIHTANGGLSRARNVGLERCRGRYVCFVDSDDWVEPRMVEELLEAQREDDAEIVVAGYWADFLNRDGSLSGSLRRSSQGISIGSASVVASVSASFVDLMGYAWNKLISRDLIDRTQARFEDGTALVEDQLFCFPLLAEARRVRVHEGAFVHYQIRDRATLGSSYYPNYVDLRIRGLLRLRDLLDVWCVPKRVSSSLCSTLLVRACHTAFKALARNNEITGDERRAAISLAAESAAGSGLLEISPARVARQGKEVFLLLALRLRLFGLIDLSYRFWKGGR